MVELPSARLTTSRYRTQVIITSDYFSTEQIKYRMHLTWLLKYIHTNEYNKSSLSDPKN